MSNQKSPTQELHIVGAGPAGLLAAIAGAAMGASTIVHERRTDVGLRFHGDFQGLENWTTREDVLEELAGLGLWPTFDHTPIREQVVYDPTGREYVFRSPEPFYYLVRRGAGPGSLDVALKQQALASGVELRFSDPVEHLPMGGIVAHGPRHADAIAVGYVFETGAADGAFAVADDRLAPGGYSYLLLHGGRATLASCLFRDFHNEQHYLDRTLEFFSNKLRLSMTSQRRFGGFGNFLLPGSAVQGTLLFAGEAAGFQDPLWGFGMRYAMLSGHLAAQAFLSGSPAAYDRMWQEQLGHRIRSAVVNRYLYGKAGNRGYQILTRLLSRSRSPRDWLRKAYAPAHWKAAIFPFARRSVLVDRRLTMDETCDCTWCRCQRDAALAAASMN